MDEPAQNMYNLAKFVPGLMTMETIVLQSECLPPLSMLGNDNRLKRSSPKRIPARLSELRVFRSGRLGKERPGQVEHHFHLDETP
jgi:hypothetical protein